jgi:hypothetical protein
MTQESKRDLSFLYSYALEETGTGANFLQQAVFILQKMLKGHDM